jgi:hypothetical protein
MTLRYRFKNLFAAENSSSGENLETVKYVIALIVSVLLSPMFFTPNSDVDRDTTLNALMI